MAPTSPLDRIVVRRGTYHDSISLMLASRDAAGVAGVIAAAAVSATPLNIDLLVEQAFAVPEGLAPDDLIIAVRAENEEAVAAALGAIEAALAGRGAGVEPSGSPTVPPHSLASAVRRDPDTNLGFVSVPGEHVAHEVATALEAGLHVFCFSAGLDVSAEAILKRRADELGLLLMGPDCGTAILDGVRLGFANAVRPGPVGLAGASGTGLQEVACLLDTVGVGVSQVIGLGGRDLHAEVGGIMAHRALDLLAEDPETEAIVLISKPPDPHVARAVAEHAAALPIPVVLAWLGSTPRPNTSESSIQHAASLEDAARRAAALVGESLPDPGADLSSGPTGGAIRGLFSGGSLCYEAMTVVAARRSPVWSNAPLDPSWTLEDPRDSRGDAFLDLGEERLTRGRAHPMIDPTIRDERFSREAADPEVGVVLLDLVLGHGAHPDPAAELAPRVADALAARAGHLTVVVAICGAANDPQDPSAQERTLREAGAVITRGAAAGARVSLVAAGETLE